MVSTLRILLAALVLAVAAPIAIADDETGPADSASAIVPRYLLMAPNGQAVSNEDFPGRFQLIAFGYTFCPDVCPTTLAEMAAILGRLGDRARHLQPLFVTVDPERDDAAQLARYAAFFDPRIVGLTGSPELIRRAADNFRVRYEKVLLPGQPPTRYAMDHSAGMFLLGPDGGFVTKFAYGTPATEIADRIATLIDARRR